MNPQSASLAVALPRAEDLPWPQRRLVNHLGRLQYGTLEVRFAAHRPFVVKGREPGPQASIVIERPGSVLRRLAWRGDLGFGESYMAGEWTSDDPASLLELMAVNLDALSETESRHPIAQALIAAQHWLNRNTRRGSRRNIAAHYDLGNDFYQRWLDPSMTYSSALFDRGGDLARAQQRKYQRMLEMVDAAPGDHILEIGCGWGGFAEYAARQGMRITGLTLSQEQLDFARQRAQRAGMVDRIDLRLCDYRDFNGTVDHVVSIEMFEAVGQEYWNDYFATVARCLRPGGRAALQVITIEEARFEQYAKTPGGFIQTYIFPGGMLPTERHLRQFGLQSGLQCREMHNFGRDYAETLARWHVTFQQSTKWLEENGYDQQFRRMWRYYLAFCEAGFRAGQIDVVHCGFVKA